MRSRTLAWVISVATASVLLLQAPAQAQGYAGLPDVKLRPKGSSTWVGDGSLTYDGAPNSQQTLTKKVAAGSKAFFDLGFDSDLAGSDTLTIQGCGHSPGFKLNYMSGTTDYSKELEGSGLDVPFGAPGTYLMKLKVRVAGSVPKGKKKTCRLRATSANDTNLTDNAFLVVIAK